MPISPPNEHSQNLNLDKKISPTILLIIVILSIIFFILGLVHLLIRLLIKPRQNEQEDLLDHVTVLQGQLQQLFHLHDSGVDQSYIDTLPVFYYKSIIGLKDPFDCAVCLCEFDLNDRLRLLPKCSHAFHMECIDTWLLSHSTCPLCRSSLLLEYGNNNGYSPIVCVLESGASVVDNNNNNSREIDGSLSGLSGLGMAESGSGQVGFFRKSCDEKLEEEKIVVVKLGKFRNVDIGEGTSESNFNNNTTATADNTAVADVNSSCGNDDLGSRRCFSMGSFAYVLDETTSLQVPIRNTPMRKQTSKTKKPSLPLKPGNKVAMSEYGCDSCREFNGIDAFKTIDNLSSIDTDTGAGAGGAGTGNGKSHLQQANVTERSKRRESFSISRIWSRRGNGNESSRRMNLEIEVDNVSELGGDEETQSCYSVDSIVNPTTTSTSNYSTRRTLLWLMGKQNKIVHHKHSNSMSNI